MSPSAPPPPKSPPELESLLLSLNEKLDDESESEEVEVLEVLGVSVS
jgi:hypothetical protein